MAVAALLAAFAAPGVASAQPPASTQPAGAPPAVTLVGSLTGVVRDVDGSGVAGVEVELAGRARRERSDARGRFHFSHIPAGAAGLTARRLGFSPGAVEAMVMPDAEVAVVIQLGPAVQSLTPVVVTERREVYDARLEGFYARQERGVGYFVGRARIAQATSSSFTDIIRAEVPGVRIGLQGNMPKAVRLRGSRCPPLVFLDGVPASAGEFDVDMLEVGSLEGIEVYNGMASVPPEFMAAGIRDRCGVIAVWTRPTEARSRRPSRASAGGGAQAARLEQLVARGEVFTAADVDVRARLDSGSFSPEYPDSLFRAGAGGRVTAEFVVDVAGAVEMNSVRIVASSDSRFDVAVRTALPDARFVAAVRRGQPVRQLVQFPVIFEASRATVPGTAARGVPPQPFVSSGAAPSVAMAASARLDAGLSSQPGRVSSP